MVGPVAPGVTQIIHLAVSYESYEMISVSILLLLLCDALVTKLYSTEITYKYHNKYDKLTYCSF